MIHQIRLLAELVFLTCAFLAFFYYSTIVKKIQTRKTHVKDNKTTRYFIVRLIYHLSPQTSQVEFAAVYTF